MPFSRFCSSTLSWREHFPSLDALNKVVSLMLTPMDDSKVLDGIVHRVAIDVMNVVVFWNSSVMKFPNGSVQATWAFLSPVVSSVVFSRKLEFVTVEINALGMHDHS
jgi:hypothetical protein